MLHCIADRMEDNAGSMLVLELPPADIRNLEQIAKVSQPGVSTTSQHGSHAEELLTYQCKGIEQHATSPRSNTW